MKVITNSCLRITVNRPNLYIPIPNKKSVAFCHCLNGDYKMPQTSYWEWEYKGLADYGYIVSGSQWFAI